ncbi:MULTISPECIES: PucR family transcriptional regulator [Kocuria]|uniref:PucR family transcriptional regulator n=1 Tax=Kocuria oceani TaxID=988827 RepID=A0ABV9TLU9_9MICC|nr:MULTISPECIES: helix-turn-helix domain-containing protein [Kocuria]
MEHSEAQDTAQEPARPGGQDRLRRAWTGMLADADRIADGITAVLLGKGPAGGGWSTPELQALLRRSTREHVGRGLRILAGRADDDGGTARAVDVWRDTGIERARQGVPLEAVLSAYTTGNLLLWEAMTDRVRDGRAEITAEELVTAGRRLWHDLGVQSEVMSEAYRRETARQELRDLRRQENYLAGLLEGRAADPEFAGQAEQILGIRADAPVACVVAVVEDPHSEPLHHPEDRVERMGGTSRWGVRDGALYGVVAMQGADEAWLSDLLRPAVEGRVGVALARQGMADTAAAFRLAARAAATLPVGARRLVWASARLPELLLETSPEVGSMIVEQVLAPVLALPAHQRTTLLDTLRALLRHSGSPTSAAEELFCHRNTVIYRSRRLVELTGCSPQEPRGRLLLELAVLAHDLAVSGGRSAPAG